MFLFGPFAVWLPFLFIGGVFVCAVLLTAVRSRPELLAEFRKRVSMRILVRSVLLFRVAFALFLTYGQYYAWSQSAFTRALLHSPLDPVAMPFWLVQLFPWVFATDLGYFLFYSWGRFWLNVVLSIGVAALFWWYLRALKRRNGRFFEEGEPELGFLMALLVGWPHFTVFVPLVFLSVVAVSVFRTLVLKRAFTTLGWPFLVATLATFICGNLLLEACGLVVLTV